MSFHTDDQKRVEHWVSQAGQAAQHYSEILRHRDFPTPETVKIAFGGDEGFGDEAVAWLTELDEVASRVCKQLAELCRREVFRPRFQDELLGPRTDAETDAAALGMDRHGIPL